METPNSKHQISNKFQPSKFETKALDYLKLEFGAYLGFGICDFNWRGCDDGHHSTRGGNGKAGIGSGGL
jgi:hypothetical protein